MKTTARGKRRRDRYDRSVPPAIWGLIAVLLLGGGALIRTIARHDRTMKLEQQVNQAVNEVEVPTHLTQWDPSWPPLPSVDVPPLRPQEVVRAAYAFAGHRAELLQYIPCYCGCERHGHRSNLDCYVKDRTPAGIPQWDTHSLTCGICLDVTRDVMHLDAAGRPVTEIREAIEARYAGRYGAGTPTPRPPGRK
ncbi:MAG: PCYCGC motif-containing (lipo)protein [Vicinamibacterales bacterium]